MGQYNTYELHAYLPGLKYLPIFRCFVSEETVCKKELVALAIRGWMWSYCHGA